MRLHRNLIPSLIKHTHFHSFDDNLSPHILPNQFLSAEHTHTPEFEFCVPLPPSPFLCYLQAYLPLTVFIFLDDFYSSLFLSSFSLLFTTTFYSPHLLEFMYIFVCFSPLPSLSPHPLLSDNFFFFLFIIYCTNKRSATLLKKYTVEEEEKEEEAECNRRESSSSSSSRGLLKGI